MIKIDSKLLSTFFQEAAKLDNTDVMLLESDIMNAGLSVYGYKLKGDVLLEFDASAYISTLTTKFRNLINKFSNSKTGKILGKIFNFIMQLLKYAAKIGIAVSIITLIGIYTLKLINKGDRLAELQAKSEGKTKTLYGYLLKILELYDKFSAVLMERLSKYKESLKVKLGIAKVSKESPKEEIKKLETEIKQVEATERVVSNSKLNQEIKEAEKIEEKIESLDVLESKARKAGNVAEAQKYEKMIIKEQKSWFNH